MNGVELPFYAIAIRDDFLGITGTDPRTITVWGTVQQARAAIRREAKRRGQPPAAFRIVELKFTGRVLEG